MLKFIELNEEKQPTTSFDITYTSLDKLDNAGLLLNNKVVVVDFDNDNIGEDKIIDYFKTRYPTLTVKTTRGIHFYYSLPSDLKLKNGADKITVGAFQVDYKTGTKAYAIVKHKGKERARSGELTLKDLPVLPIEMYPLAKAKNITGLSEGDGRNNSLFYHLRLIREQRKDVDIVAIANFINDYILNESLKANELATLIDSVNNLDVNSSGQYNGDPKDMIDFAEFVVKELDIKIFNGTLYFKDGLNYSKDRIKLNKAINKYLRLRRSQMTELEAQLYIYAELVDSKKKFNVKLRNGVIIDENVVDYDCGFTPFYLDVSYDANAYDEHVDNFLDFICCGRKDERVVIEEILGHILLVDRFPHKIFFLTGSGANGKSTFVEMLTKWTGDLSSHIDIANFDDGTSLISLIGKVVNVADDVDAIYLEKSKNLKTMASGNTVGARAIYSQPITLKNTATLIFTANEPPVFKDKSDGIGRRLMIIPFDNKVKKRIYNLDELLSSDNAKSYLLNLALKGVKRILDNNLDLTSSETIEESTKQYYLDNDSVLSYLNDYPAIENNPVSSIYEAYAEYCEDSNLKAVSLNKFSRRLKSLGYDVIPSKMLGKTVRIIQKMEVTNEKM
ncbi:MAG: bifunctional DNA primase/polymerase [Clostridiales bacterium]|nr:bifunctional DNA primase/polymerase [Clostridiales bacterium]